jgi:hypothetical protein
LVHIPNTLGHQGLLLQMWGAEPQGKETAGLRDMGNGRETGSGALALLLTCVTLSGKGDKHSLPQRMAGWAGSKIKDLVGMSWPVRCLVMVSLA